MRAPKKPTWFSIAGGALGVTAIGTFQAGLIALCALVFNLGVLPFLELGTIFSVLNSGRFRLYEGMIRKGRESGDSLIALRMRYIRAIEKGVRVRKWPSDPLYGLAAVGLVVSKGALRAFFFMAVVYLVFSLISAPTPLPFLTAWAVMTVVESILVGISSFARGTLVLVGMSVDELRDHFESVIAKLPPDRQED